ncbi:hypothetical protein LCGC14_2723390, partial [marine sediment metagenome]
IRIEEGLLSKELDDMPRYESVPVVEEPKFKKGGRVKINPTVEGNLKVWPDVILQLEKTDFIGTIIEETPDRMDGGYYVNIGGLEHFSQHFFFNRELAFLIENETEIDPNPNCSPLRSRTVNLTGD